MPEYEVNCKVTATGTIFVEADDEDAAEQMAVAKFSISDIDDLDDIEAEYVNEA